MGSWVINEGSSSSDIIAIGALLVSIISVAATVMLNRRQEKRSYMDEFWFREIFAPSCVLPVIAFRAKWEAELTELGGTSIDEAKGSELVDQIGVDATGLLQRVWIAKLFDGDFYAFCASELEHIEDGFLNTLSAAHLRPASGRRSPAAALTDQVTATCARILQRAATLHGTGLKIADDENHSAA